jgi:hypothetical protein
MQTRISIKLILSVLVAATLASCESGYWNCLRGNGIAAEETRNLIPFTGVVSEGAFDILIIPDSVYTVKVEADENLIPYIRTRISSGKLIIDTGTRNCLKSDSPMLLTVRLPQVEYINLAGSGLISGDDISADDMRVEIMGSGRIDLRGLDVNILDGLITGSGDLIFWGSAEETDFDIAGSGNIDAYQLDSDKCIASISGSGSMYVSVESRLDVYISGSGSIYYKGNPVVTTNITGSGSVISTNK